MDSLFAHRPIRKRRIYIMVVISLLMHASLVGLAEVWPTTASYPIEPIVTELTADQMGEPVQELIAPKDEPQPTPDTQPTPPPDDTPPPEDTPPPSDEPDMSTPPPPKKDVVKPHGTPYPKDAKRGDHPQAGVVGPGTVAHAEKTTGTPGGGHLHTSKPPYPYQARAARLQGSGSVRVTFDGSGHVSSAVIEQSVGSGILDNNTISYAKANWTGPPNTTTTVPITYRLQ